MTDYRVPLYKVFWDQDDVDAVSRIVKRGMFWTDGPSAKEFEKEIAEKTQRKYAVSFNSGTSGLTAVLISLGIGSGDEVIVPSFTFSATSNCVVHTGAQPVFAEIEDITFGLDPGDVADKITENTRAIMPIHYGGGSCRIDELVELAEENGLVLIEDAAESLGCINRCRPVGSFGKAAMFSFCGNKVLTTGEGGMVVTDDPELADRMKLVRSHGRLDGGEYFKSSKSFDYILPGHNWRMPEVISELGRSQLKKLDYLVKKRREAAAKYDECLDGLPLRVPVALSAVKHIYQMYTVFFDYPNMREKVRSHLAAAGIMNKVYFECVHLTTFYKKSFGTTTGMLPITEDLSCRVLTIPIYPTIQDDEIQFVCHEIRRFLE